MGGVLYRASTQWRRRLRAQLVLVLLIATTGAIAMTTFAGARRTASVTDRFTEATGTPDVFADLRMTDFEGADAIAELPQVVEVGRIASFASFPQNGEYTPLLTSADGKVGKTIDRGILVAGRRAADDAADEITLSESQAEQLGLTIGDRIPLASMSTAQMDACMTDEAACEDAMHAPEGPAMTVDVVGIVRQGIDIEGGGDFTYSYLPQGFFDRYRDEIPWFALMVARLEPGASVEDFVTDARAVLPDDVEPVFESTAPSATKDSASVYALALALFGFVAAVVGAIVVSQSLIRQAASHRGEQGALQAVGMTARGRVLDFVAVVVPAAVAGLLVATVVAYGASTWMPRGVARHAEPDPGLQFDTLVLIGGAIAILIGVGLLAAFAAWSAGRRERRRAHRSSRVAQLSVGGPGNAYLVGTRFAFERAGASGAPVRSAILACAAAMSGVLAAVGFGAALAHLVDTPELQGWGWDVAGIDDDIAEDVAAVPGVAAVAVVDGQVPIEIEGRPLYGYALDPIAGTTEWSMIEGHMPTNPFEVALGRDTMARAGVAIGDEVHIAGEEGEVDARVVGTAVFPPHDDSTPLADSVLLDPQLVDEIGMRDGFSHTVVRLDPTEDRTATLARLSELDGGQDLEFPFPPPEIDRLEQVNHLPRLLGLVVALLSGLGVAHALALSVRRRSRDLALLRVLGFRPREVGVAVVWQALSLAAVGIVIGLPLGVLIARLAWNAVADSVGVRAVHEVVPLSLAATACAIVALAIVAAVVPARRAARLRPADVLRTE